MKYTNYTNKEINNLSSNKIMINDPDIIVLSEKRISEGKSVFLFQKKINNNIYVVVNVSDKHHNLEIQTMYKKITLPL